MRTMGTVTLLAVGSLMLGPVLSGSAVAQVVTEHPGFVGTVKGSGPGCPDTVWRIARHATNNGGTVTGIVYYADASGASRVTGAYKKDGKFTLHLTSTMGKGPVGTVTGMRGPDGALTADLKGEGCANGHLSMPGVPDIATAPGG
jgi:hypothetical protein